jgi:GTP-binding protein
VKKAPDAPREDELRPIPKIALVGRPNVGKSTLFNRICGQRKAITDGRPGSTRDRNYAQCSWRATAYELIDTGGLLMESADILAAAASDQARLAIREAELIILVVDGRAGLLPDDGAIAADLRRAGKRVVVAVNKAEARQDLTAEFAALGFDHTVPISAEHGTGIGDLLDLAFELLPRVPLGDDAPRPLRVALVGSPNVGKSSILNRLLGAERAVVSVIPGTTRDSVDGLLVRGEKRYLFVDTAGIRRRAVLKNNVDQVSVLRTSYSIRRADVAIVVLDAEVGMREVDTRVAGEVHEAGRGIVIAVNKWDGERSKGRGARKAFAEGVQDALKFASHAPVVFVSALAGTGLGVLLKAVDDVWLACQTRVTTGRLNRLLGSAVAALAPRTEGNVGPVKLLYGTQIGVAPPTFVLALNRAATLQTSYQRYLEHRIRAEFGFGGAPIVLKTRARRH